MQTWTPEQILSLAPDPSSANAGRDSSSPRKWQNAGRNDRALWGEHQGSGSKPYLTSIDLTEPAFKCSCPSRKFPCKHGLGLFLAFYAEPAAFPVTNPPKWAAEWLASRAEKEERAAKREERKEQVANDPDAKAKAEKAAARTAAQRKSRVDKGIEDLDRWLCDLIRTGFSAPNLATYSFWESQAARLVDGQAPGLARIVRNMGGLAASSTGDASRHERLLEQAGRLRLIIQAYNRLETLSPTMQDEIRTLVGWTQDQADLIASAPTLPETHRARDKWFVASQVISDDDKLRAQSTWLWGTTHPRPALIMDFAFGNNPLDKSLVVGTQIDAELVYFPGAYPVRALVKERFGPPTDLTNLTVWSIQEALAEYNRALQQNPLLDRFPMFLADVIPVFTSNSGGDVHLTYVRNAEGDTLPVNPATDSQTALGYLALSGGHPLMIFGTWNGKHFSPLNAWANTLDLDSPSHLPGEDTRGAGDAEPTIWDALLTSALLGTERRPLDVPPTNGPLGALLTRIRESTTTSPEQNLLAAASTLTIYRQAGKVPAHDGTPLPDPCDAETLKVCSPRAIAHLYDMLNGNNSRALTEWLETAAAHGKHITHDVLPAMLDLGQAQPYYQPYILPVIGNRGRWLAQQFGAGTKDEGPKDEGRRWAYVRNAAAIETPDEESTLSLWETGSLDARVAILLDMRKTNPDRARELIESVWKQENAKTRAALVRTLDVSLSMRDEPFLESILDDRSSEVAQAATKHLVLLPESRFLQRAIASTQSALKLNRVKQNKLFGFGQSISKDTIEVTLPDEYTPAMKRDQVEPKSTTPAFGDHAYWLLQQISRVPPRIWSARLQAEPRVIVDAAVRTKEWMSLLMQSFVPATLTHKDAQWAEAFLAHGIAALPDYTLSSLVSLLPPERRNQLITGILATRPEALYTSELPLDFLWTLQKPWTIELCRAVLKSVAHHIKHNTPKQSHWQVSQSLSTFAYSMPPSIYLEAQRTLVTNESTSFNSKEAVDEFLTTLKFRQDMLQALQQ